MIGSWVLVEGSQAGQVLVTIDGRGTIGQVNRRAAAILAPLMHGQLVGSEVRQNQEAGGRRNQVLYIYALLGVEGNDQVCPFHPPLQVMKNEIRTRQDWMRSLEEQDYNMSLV